MMILDISYLLTYDYYAQISILIQAFIPDTVLIVNYSVRAIYIS